MSIFRVQNHTEIPEWLKINASEQVDTDEIQNVERLNVSEEVDEKVLAQECEQIEACAESNKIYHYNSSWDGLIISHLKEYALACGLDKNKFKGADPSMLRKADSQKMNRTAQVDVEEKTENETMEDKLKELMTDPFHIEERTDMSHMEKRKWESVEKQNVLTEQPSTITSGNVIALRGSENYFENSDVNPAKNQNSITNPGAIEQLAKNETMDNGERLKKERERKEAQKIENHKNWEKEKLLEVHSKNISKGSVFPTESLNAQTGLESNSSKMGVYSKFNPDSIPEKTAGELISDKNKERKEAIQRKVEKDDWQKPSRQSSRSISDDFADSLKQNLKNI